MSPCQRYGTRAAFAAAFACAIASAPAVHAQSQKAAAEALFEEGRRLMADGKTGDACPKFADSEQLDPSSGTLLNLANCYEKLGRSASAWATYKEAASLASSNGRSDHLGVAQKRAEALGAKLMRVTVQVATPVEGLEVKRDGVVVTRAEWGLAIPTDPGPHNYEATAPGYKTWGASVQLTSDSPSLTLVVPALEAAPATAAVTPPPGAGQPPVAPAPDTKPAEPEHAGGLGTQRIAGIIFAGVGVVGLGVGGGFAAVAKSKYDTSLASCPHDKNMCTPQGVTQRDDARSAGNVATASMAIGAAALVGGAVLWLTAPSRDSGEAHARIVNTSRLMIAPTLGGAGAGAMVQGQW